MADDTSLIKQALEEFYNSYVVETANGTFTVIRSMTYGEMVISFLLLNILLLMLFRWLWSVIR